MAIVMPKGKDVVVAGAIVAAIFGGSYVTDIENQLPSHVGKLQATYFVDGFEQQELCGITPIGDGFGLTAAHCLGNGADELRVDGVPVKGKAIILDSYDFPTDDIAVVAGAFPLNVRHAEIGSPELIRKLVKGDDARIAGYGTTEVDENGSPMNPSETLKFLDVEIKARNRLIFTVFDPTLQGGGCVGDSGGPLFVDGKIVGTTRSVNLNPDGSRCSTPGFTTDYANVLTYKDWVNDVKTYCMSEKGKKECYH